MTLHRLIKSAEEDIGRMLRSGDVPSHTSAAALSSILAELRLMDTSESGGEHLPAYPRMIVDSWPYGDPLGRKLLEIAELYRRTR